MTTQELYKWFVHNTDIPRKSEGTGWKNSVRHSLSMNDVSNLPGMTCSLLLIPASLRHCPTLMILSKSQEVRLSSYIGIQESKRNRLGIGRSNDPTYITPATPYPGPAHDSWRFGGHHLQNPSQEESEYTGHPGDPGSVGTMASVGSCPELEIGFGGIWMAVEDSMRDSLRPL
ncbi:hypothetical protein CSUB01_08012 [Colletotrichum sublineola]|uniref:Fork-head domain-containing protein n=1 Tax=Colletotrichum sublineola TaxID=1173701 RepID=A0A066X2L9_COLSU|nr:hypothetical protein CSUB01_08012 [Colletotrichum sublineola]